jgi:hypothetical protein
VRVLELARRAPPLRRPLLEDAQRVSVAVVEVADVGLLVRRGQRDARRPGGHSAPDSDTGDDRGVAGLLGVDADGPARGGRRTALAVGDRADTEPDQREDHAGDDEEPQGTEKDASRAGAASSVHGGLNVHGSGAVPVTGAMPPARAVG